MKPPFAYYGGKTRFVNIIKTYMPPPSSYEMYLEAFAGSAALFFSAATRWAYTEILNDLNGDITNFFQVLRDNPQPLIDKLQLTPYSRQENRETDHILATSTDPVERARAFYVRAEQSFARNQRAISWGIPSARHNLTIRWDTKTKPDRLLALAARLRVANIENLDAIYCMSLYDRPNTFIYIDPPYLAVADERVKQLAYRGHDIDHEALIDFVLQAKSRIIISGYRNPVYSRLEDHGWGLVEFHAKTNAGNNRKSTRDGKPTYNTNRVECLWISPNCKFSQMVLF